LIYTSTSGHHYYYLLIYFIWYNIHLGGKGLWSKTSAPGASWKSIASDNTGKYLIACDYAATGSVYISTSGTNY
jgi:hypothetical protein